MNNWNFDVMGDPPTWSIMAGLHGMAITGNAEGFHVEHLDHDNVDIRPIGTFLTLMDAKAAAEENLSEIIVEKNKENL